MARLIQRTGRWLAVASAIPLAACIDTSVIIEPTLEGLAAACGQSTYAVNTSNEIVSGGSATTDLTVHDALCTGRSACSLRAALYTAAVCRASGPKTIVLPAGGTSFFLSSNQPITPLLRVLDRREEPDTGPVRLPRVYGDVTIEGNGAVINYRRNPFARGTDFARLFHVHRNGSLILNDLTISGFQSEGGFSELPRVNSGQVVLNDGVLRMTNVAVRQSQNAIDNYGYARILSSVFERNNGAFRNWARASLDQARFINNQTTGSPVALISSSSFTNMRGRDARLISSIFQNNMAVNVIANGGQMEMVNSSVIGNTAHRRNRHDVIQNAGDLTLSNVTVSDNGSDEAFSIIRCEPGLDPANVSPTADASLTLRDTTLADNVAGASLRGDEQCLIRYDNALIAANSIRGSDCAATLSTDVVNRSADTDGTCGTGFSIAGPRLAPLAFNGGTTPNRLPLAGSPLIDAGSGCGTFDQRLLLRPQGRACDIGAVESRP